MYKYWTQQQVCNSLYLFVPSYLHEMQPQTSWVMKIYTFSQFDTILTSGKLTCSSSFSFLNGSQTSPTIRIVANIVYLILYPGPQNLKLVAHRE